MGIIFALYTGVYGWCTGILSIIYLGISTSIYCCFFFFTWIFVYSLPLYTAVCRCFFLPTQMDIYLPLYTAVSAPPPVVQALWSRPWPPCVWASGRTPLSWTLIYFQTPRSLCPRSVHAYWCSPGFDRQDWQNECNKQRYFDIYWGNNHSRVNLLISKLCKAL